MPINGSQKGDVYSFALILYEMHGRKGPFGDLGLTNTEILRRVLYPGDNILRPQLDKLENCMDFVKETLTLCWSEVPENRPDFKVVRNKLRPLRKGMKANIFDNMISMMETYANNLETIVDERTALLIEEKRKTDELLYEMLPKYVAEQLKIGEKIDPESFDCVTIYFSDIVGKRYLIRIMRSNPTSTGFTALSSSSTPLQVVDMLNDLYTLFDSIIPTYDVYKVSLCIVLPMHLILLAFSKHHCLPCTWCNLFLVPDTTGQFLP